MIASATWNEIRWAHDRATELLEKDPGGSVYDAVRQACWGLSTSTEHFEVLRTEVHAHMDLEYPSGYNDQEVV